MKKKKLKDKNRTNWTRGENEQKTKRMKERKTTANWVDPRRERKRKAVVRASLKKSKTLTPNKPIIENPRVKM